MTGRLAAVQERFRKRLEANAEVLYPHQGTFTRVQNGVTREYVCRFAIDDPSRSDRTAIASAEAFASTQTNAAYTDVRFLWVYPDDKRPPEGSVLTTPWDGGRLELKKWSQPSDFTGEAVGLCLLRR